MLQQRTTGFNISASESLKIIGQNLETIDQLKEAAVEDMDMEKVDLNQMEVFDFDSRKLVIGQWVDVKDTIHQWVDLLGL